jgi:hypothetical protein
MEAQSDGNHYLAACKISTTVHRKSLLGNLINGRVST